MTGLENTIAAQTKLSYIDGNQGQLWIHGRPLNQWVQLQYLEAINELLDSEYNLSQFNKERQAAYQWLAPHLSLLKELSPLEALKTGFALLPNISSLKALALGPVLLANHHRLNQGLATEKPDIKLDPITDFLRVYRNTLPSEAEMMALKTYWLTVAEHGLNASTFTCRVIASTQSDLASAISGAIGALKGPLHGGAPAPVLQMLDTLETTNSISEWVQNALNQGERIMGFGHRVYRQRDPRAEVLKLALEKVSPTPRLAFAAAAETEIINALQEAKPHRTILTNVEFYTAILLEGLGFESSEFTAVFALGRVLGWTAHYIEQKDSGRLIRPRAEYIGPPIKDQQYALGSC